MKGDPQVSLISVTPIRCFGLAHPPEIEVTDDAGVVENRRFVLVDAEGKRLRSSLTYWPVPLRASYDAESERLSVRFPDGTVAAGSTLELGEEVFPELGVRTIPSRVLEGPWTEELSRFAGSPVRIARRSPDTGERDLDTLKLIKGYRGVRNGEAIDFGVYARVVRPGRVRVGDAVSPL